MEFAKERYSRQIILDKFGTEAQEKLSKAKVLVIGAGGLGCPILQYLTVSGVGNIGIVDPDTVSFSNLNRQVLYGQNDIGNYKVEVAKQKLLLLNDNIKIKLYKKRWLQSDCIEHFPEYDIMVDATDNFATRYLINDACVLLNKPLVYGAVSKFEGQVAVFNMASSEKSNTVNYRDIFPEMPKNHEVQNCAEAGVLSVLPGIIGVMQAAEVIKIITGIGNVLANQILNYNALNQTFFTLKIKPNPDSIIYFPSSVSAFLNTNYDFLCEFVSSDFEEISIYQWLKIQDKTVLVDVREEAEKPKLGNLFHLSIPLSILPNNFEKLENFDIVFICQSGKRSVNAAILANKTLKNSKIYSLKGGVIELQKRKLI